MFGPFASAGEFGQGRGLGSGLLQVAEFAAGAVGLAVHGVRLGAAFQHHGEGQFGASREQDGVAGEFHAGDEGGGELDLGAALGLEVGDAGDEGVVATGLGVRRRVGRRGEDADGVADDVVVGVGGEGVGEVVRGWHGWGL